MNLNQWTENCCRAVVPNVLELDINKEGHQASSHSWTEPCPLESPHYCINIIIRCAGAAIITCANFWALSPLPKSRTSRFSQLSCRNQERLNIIVSNHHVIWSNIWSTGCIKYHKRDLHFDCYSTVVICYRQWVPDLAFCCLRCLCPVSAWDKSRSPLLSAWPRSCVCCS